MGIGLMKGLSEELRGNIQICSENGTTVAIQFNFPSATPTLRVNA
jgi:hypothetical protein